MESVSQRGESDGTATVKRVDAQTQVSASFDDETRLSWYNFECSSSGDEYAGVGTCSVISETDSDFDEANRADDCVVWDTDSEMVGEPEPIGEPAEVDRNPPTC